MRFKKSSKKVCRVGLDIGTSSIKVAEVLKDDQSYKLLRFGLKPINNTSESNLSDQVKALLTESGISTKEINISFSGPSIVVRFIPMPRMSPQDLKSAIKFEGEKYIPFNMDETYYDSCILEEGSGEKGQMLVLLAAAKKGLVDSRIKILKDMGFNVSVVDVDTFAIFNAFMASQKNIDSQKSIALINMGASQINALFFRGTTPYFIRDVQIGGLDLDKAISKNLNIDLRQAAEIRLKPGERAQEMVDAVRSILTNTVEEIKLSFGYYENQFGKTIEEIYLSGGLVHMPEFLKFLEENLGLKPSAWDPFLGFELDSAVDKEGLDKIKPELAVSAGLALRT